VIQERAVRQATAVLLAKNLEAESAVDELISLAASHPRDPKIEPCSPSDEKKIKAHYRGLTQTALLSCNQRSLNLMKSRICSRVVSGLLTMERPFFELDVQLAVPSVRLSPSLDDVQSAINRAAVAVLECSKKVQDWNQQNIPERRRKMFFDILSKDLGIIKVCLLLTGALHGTKNFVSSYLTTFQKYDWLWKDDKEGAYKAFLAKHNDNPNLDDFEAELVKYMKIEHEIEQIPLMSVIGALSLNTNNLKLQLKNESRAWQFTYASKLHSQAKERM